MSAETLLDVFVPPKDTVGHSAVLVAMSGVADFLEDALQRFTGLRARQRAELGNVLVYLMLDGHASSSRQDVFAPGRVPSLHEFHPRPDHPGSLLHAKIALLAFAQNHTGKPVYLRLAVLTANYTYTSARQQLELAWVVNAPVDTACPEDRADIAAAGAFVETLLNRRFYRDEHKLVSRKRKLTSRLDALLKAALALAVDRKPRFIHSLDRPLYDQIEERFHHVLKDKPRNLLLCGSGFYEEPSDKPRKPTILGKLQDMRVFTANVRRVVLVEPAQANAVATWAKGGEVDGWEIVRSFDALGHNRRLHAKFIYAGYLRKGCVSNGCLYLGSGNLSRRGILTHGGMTDGNVEAGVVFVVNERLDREATKSRMFWSDKSEAIRDTDWVLGEVGDAPDSQPILQAPPILSAIIETTSARRLHPLWREDAVGVRVSISWTGRDWFDVQPDEEIRLNDDENPTALHVRDASNRKWVVPVVDAAGRIGWQPPRFETYGDALSALLDFPIRPAEATDDDDRDDGGAKSPGTGEAIEQEKSYALHAAAELVEKVAALQATLPESMIDDWLDHLDRMFRASFPEALIGTWREHGINVFEHLKAVELRPLHLSNKHTPAAKKYFAILDGAARAWGLVQ